MMSNGGPKGSYVSNNWLEAPFIGHASCINASLAQLEMACRNRVSDPQITALSEGHKNHSGCLSSLIGDSVRVGYVTFGEPVTVRLWNLDWFGCVLPLRGRARLEQYPSGLQGSNGPFFLHPKSDQHWQFSPDCELLILRVAVNPEQSAQITDLLTRPRDGTGRSECAQVMMESLPYRLHHGLGHAEQLELLQPIRIAFLQLFGFFPEKQAIPEGARAMDPRVLRVMDHLRQLPSEDYDLESICDIAHMSRRALYYAFERNLQCTPYAYSRACQLIRIRLALLQDPGARLSIAHHAAAHGVQHMGRFAAHYRAQFGERPSETRERLSSVSAA